MKGVALAEHVLHSEKLFGEVSHRENAGWQQQPGAILHRWFRKASQAGANNAPDVLEETSATEHGQHTPAGFASVEKAIGVLDHDIQQDKQVRTSCWFTVHR